MAQDLVESVATTTVRRTMSQVLFHVREEPRLARGALITPGRFGGNVRALGSAHQFWSREQQLEQLRVKQAPACVSRLDAVFAFESYETATSYKAAAELVYLVEATTLGSRHDMLWLTWMGEPNVTPARIEDWCGAYWRGESTADRKPGANPGWEWIFPGPLRVL